MNQTGFSQITLVAGVTIILAALGGGTLYFRNFSGSEMPAPAIEKLAAKESEEKSPAPLPTPAKKETAPLQKPAALPKPSQTPHSTNQSEQARDPWRDPISPAPTTLALPILIKDIKADDELISPYGVIRHSRDGGIGHGGIDFPLERGSPIYAVANGTIIKNNLEDVGGGNTVDILILQSEFPGEGWIFKYEHIALGPGLTVGNAVQKGQKIGVNALTERGNNHVGLEYHFKSFTIARNKSCWVDRLEPAARQQLESEFNRIKMTPAFIQSWQTANEEGYYQYRGLLDEAKYPSGPQLCYPLGTDARMSVN